MSSSGLTWGSVMAWNLPLHTDNSTLGSLPTEGIEVRAGEAVGTESQTSVKGTVGSEEYSDEVAFISSSLNGLGLRLTWLKSARQISD